MTITKLGTLTRKNRFIRTPPRALQSLSLLSFILRCFCHTPRSQESLDEQKPDIIICGCVSSFCRAYALLKPTLPKTLQEQRPMILSGIELTATLTRRNSAKKQFSQARTHLTPRQLNYLTVSS